MTLRKLTTLASGQRDTIRSGLSSLALRIAGLVSTFGLGVVLARTLGPAEYGIYGLVTSVAALAMTVSLLGTPQLAVRELSVRSAKGDWAGVKALMMRFGLASSGAALLIGLLAIGLGLVLGSPSHRLPIILGALLTPTMAITMLTAAELRGLGAMVKGQMMDILGRPAAAFLIILALVLADIPLRATDALWVQVAVSAAAAAISLFWIARILPTESRSVSVTAQVPWLAAAIPLGLVDLLRQVDGTYGVILMGWFGSAEDLGIYRVALSCMMVVGMPINILHIIQAPAVARLYNFGETEELQRLLSATSAWMVALVAPITLAAWLIGKPAIVLVFGAAYAEAWLPLFILCVAQLAFGLFGMGPILLAMCGGERQLIKIYLFAVGLGILAAIPLVGVAGASGAAAAMIISTGLIGLLSWRHGKTRMGVDATFLPLLLYKVKSQ
jgi:O-antigen/teichoic acid export membrane protein